MADPRNGWYVKDSDGRPYWYEDGVIYALVGYAKRGSKGSADDALVEVLAERDAAVARAVAAETALAAVWAALDRFDGFLAEDIIETQRVEMALSLVVVALRDAKDVLDVPDQPKPTEGEHCQDCGAPYLTVYTLPDEVWAVITPSSNPGGGLLCPPCADTRARGHGLTLHWYADVPDQPNPTGTDDA